MALDWEKAARQDKVRQRGGDGPKPRGPSNEQRACLKKLAKQAGEPTPMPLTRSGAMSEIKRLRNKLRSTR